MQKAQVITPNLTEAAILLGLDPESLLEQRGEDLAVELSGQGQRSVVVTGVTPSRAIPERCGLTTPLEPAAPLWRCGRPGSTRVPGTCLPPCSPEACDGGEPGAGREPSGPLHHPLCLLHRRPGHRRTEGVLFELCFPFCWGTPLPWTTEFDILPP